MLILTGVPLVIVFFKVFSRLFGKRDTDFRFKLNLALASLASTIALFALVTFLFWRFIESTTPEASAFYAAGTRNASSAELIAEFGEPGDRERSNSGNDVFVYDALLKYSSGDWGIGQVSVELDSSGNAIGTWTTD